jgi:hypothetical protein
LFLSTTGIVGALLILLVDSNYDRAIGNTILGGVALTTWVFVILYTTRSPWRATAAGRSVLYDQLCLGSLSAYLLIANFLPRQKYPIINDIRSILFLGILLALLNMILTLFRVQQTVRKQAREEKEKQEAEVVPESPDPSTPRLEDLD